MPAKPDLESLLRLTDEQLEILTAVAARLHEDGDKPCACRTLVSVRGRPFHRTERQSAALISWSRRAPTVRCGKPRPVVLLSGGSGRCRNLELARIRATSCGARPEIPLTHGSMPVGLRAVRRSRCRAICSRFVPAPIQGDHYGYRPRSAALWVFVRRNTAPHWTQNRDRRPAERSSIHWHDAPAYKRVILITIVRIIGFMILDPQRATADDDRSQLHVRGLARANWGGGIRHDARPSKAARCAQPRPVSGPPTRGSGAYAIRTLPDLCVGIGFQSV
jgi:hypothetical protein